MFSNISGDGTFLAIDDCSRNAYKIKLDLDEDMEWNVMRDAIPMGLTDRHLISINDDLTFEHRVPISLVAYSKEEMVSLVKFYHPEKNVFGDEYIEDSWDTPEEEASQETPSYDILSVNLFNPQILPFPVILDLPPMKGAAFGLDASTAFGQRFVTDLSAQFYSNEDPGRRSTIFCQIQSA